MQSLLKKEPPTPLIITSQGHSAESKSYSLPSYQFNRLILILKDQAGKTNGFLAKISTQLIPRTRKLRLLRRIRLQEDLMGRELSL